MAVDLAELLFHFSGAVERQNWRAASVERVQANLAEWCRIVRIAPPTQSEVSGALAGLGPEEIGRTALAAGAMHLPSLCELPPGAQALATIVHLARATPLLTLRLLEQSPLRREEFARRLIAGLGGAVQGETPEQSQRELRRLDYGRVLADAERAKATADERLDWFRRLQQEQDRRQPRPRGKWW